MISESELETSARLAHIRLSKGERIVTNHYVMDKLVDLYPSETDVLASCMNKHQCGTLDCFVAWYGSDNKPKDLEWKGMTAYGSVDGPH